MPQAIPFIIQGVGYLLGTSTVVTAIASAVATLAISSAQQRKAERQARAAFDSAQVDRMANIPNTIAPRELVMGRVRKGGQVFFRASLGEYSSLLVICLAVAAHEIDGIEQVYFNDVPVDINDQGQVTSAPYGRETTITSTVQVPPGSLTITLPFDPIPGSVGASEHPPGGVGGHEISCTVSGRVVTVSEPLPGWTATVGYQYKGYNSFVRVHWNLGSPTQSADPVLMSLLPGVWTAAHRAQGVAYLVCQFAYDDTAFPSGVPNVTVRMRGAKIYDPRSGATVFTENPALMLRHVLTHPQFGKRTSLTTAETARIIAAANICDQMVSYTGADWVQLFRAAIVVQFGAAAADVFDDLAQAMGGMWADVGGEMFLRAGSWQAPVMELTEKDLAVVNRDLEGSGSQSPIGISVHRPRNDKFNVVAPRIWDQAAGYKETPLTPLKADTLIADDGAELVQEVTMPAVFYAMQALHCAGIMIRDARDPLTLTFPAKLSAFPLEVFDSVTVTLARYGWASKEFIVMERRWTPDGSLVFTMKETAAAIYLRGAAFPPQGYGDNTNLPSPWNIQPPGITQVLSGESELVVQTDGTIVNGVRVIWQATDNQAILQGGSIQVQYKILPAGEWISEVVPGSATQVKFLGIPDLAVILIRARSKSVLATSDWGVQRQHTVIGKTEPPPGMENLNIAGDVLTWSLPRRVPDLSGFIFRFHYGTNFDWGSAVPLHTGVITESPYQLVTRPGGNVTIMGKAIDTSGNQSLTAANIVTDLGDPPIANIIEQVDFKALGWPGDPADQSGWTLVGGNLEADALDSFYGTDNQAFYGAQTLPFYDVGAYGQMVYVSDLVSISSALTGSILTLQTETQGIDLVIEYRLAGPDPFYGADGDYFYGPDPDSFYGAPGEWLSWPGQLIAANDGYQFRVTIGAGTDQGVLSEMVLTVDAPDLEEDLDDFAIGIGGTVIPHTLNFSKIVTIQATLQVNGSGAVRILTDKTVNLAPVIVALNAANASVGGATADITLKGY